MADNEPCSHLKSAHLAGGQLEVVLSLDDYLGIAEALVRCPACHQHYLIELLDIKETRRAFRLTAIDPAIADQLVRDLTRGSCDAQRAATEVQTVKTLHAQSTFWLVAGNGSFTDLELNNANAPLPTCTWRELPLDGRWLAT